MAHQSDLDLFFAIALIPVAAAGAEWSPPNPLRSTLWAKPVPVAAEEWVRPEHGGWALHLHGAGLHAYRWRCHRQACTQAPSDADLNPDELLVDVALPPALALDLKGHARARLP